MSSDNPTSPDAPEPIVTGTTPAGWYPDGTGGQRWWDGAQWTEHHQPAPTPDAVPAPSGVPEGRRKRSPLVLAGIIAAGIVGIGILVGAVLVTISALQPAAPTQDQAEAPTTAEPAPTFEATPSPEPTDDSGSEIGDAIAEREAFMKAQKQPVDGSLLVAQTPEQRAFVDEAKVSLEERGGVWDAQTESYTLALTLDACETSILNGHKVDENTVRTHAETSPLLAALIEGAQPDQQAALKSGLMNLAVTGISHVCPADFDQWNDSVQSIGDSW